MSEDSPFVQACSDIEHKQQKQIAKAAAYVCTYAFCQSLQEAAENILQTTQRSKNPAKNANGKSVAGVLFGIVDDLMPKDGETNESSLILPD